MIKNINSLGQSPIQLLAPSQSVARVTLKGKLQEEDGTWIVWWYGALSKNGDEGTIPLNSVLFRRLLPNGMLGNLKRFPAAMTHLGSLRFGSAWTKGNLVGHMELSYLPEKKVSFNDGDWSLVSARDAGLVRPLHLHHSDNYTMLIELTSDDGVKILVPCAEFFVRAYGRSTETVRTLLRFPWKEAKNRFYFDAEPDANKWVKLNHRVKSSEAVFLHHALYDDYTKDICERFYATLEAGFDKQKKRQGSLPCLDTGPWFRGAALIEGKGIWLEQGKVFLMLDIKGMSEPVGDMIVIQRQGTDATGGEQGERVYTRSPRDIPIDQILDITDSEPPDSDSPRVFYDPPFKRLGEKRPRLTKRRKASGKLGVALQGDDDAQKVSTGDAHGGDKGTHKGEGNAPEHFLEGALAKMWKTCSDLKTAYEAITKVEWFTFDDEFVEGGTPGFEPIRPHASKEPIAANSKVWTYLSAKTRNVRGVLIIRVTCGSRTFYIFEIQRKRHFSVSGKKSTSFKEEKYRGLMVELPSDSIAAKTEIKLILQKLCACRGRIPKDNMSVFGPMSKYGHTRFNHDENHGDIVYENVLVTKFSQLGMHLQRKEKTTAGLTPSESR
ncbi:hypothetical protein [Pseudomonas sp. URIL14HWK12:I7]|uniref:hypothetical protein n=1 Tax=Pseudomonas sp. URIL14HWK12:I7 TaxID=1283285 RepID=UPI0012DC936E|nr:hypothetical protein [Pseudomonas sp. URIL14HWK12:I7]